MKKNNIVILNYKPVYCNGNNTIIPKTALKLAAAVRVLKKQTAEFPT